MRTTLKIELLLLVGLLSQTLANYPWPMAPMNVQHPISATLDECRGERDHFHSGTDMPLTQGGEVLNVAYGQVLGFDPNGSNAWIRVGRFAYVHVTPNPALNVGDWVDVGEVVGWTNDQNHIHFKDGGGASGTTVVNSLRAGGIEPFHDPYHPRSPEIRFVVDGTSQVLPGNVLSGHVDIWAQAADTTDMTYSVDMNNGIYRIGWGLWPADMSAPLEGPHFWFRADELYSSSYVSNVYAPGSNTSTYIYIVTNRISTNGFLDCTAYPTGNYVIGVLSADIQGNWDTTFVPVVFTEQDFTPPDPPTILYLGDDGQGNLRLEWAPSTAGDLAGYKLEFSFDGQNWSSNQGPETLTADMTSYTFQNFPHNVYVQFRMKAVDQAAPPNESEYSDTYGVLINPDAPQVLVVDGFDRTSGSWNQPQHNFATYYGEALAESNHSLGIQTAANEWVISRGNLDGFDAVVWFLGDDSRTDETFSTTEQSIVSNYLSQGGNFFTSGAEIGYDLSAGNAQDQAFLTQVLHVGYAGDNAGSYSVAGTGEYFSGLNFTYGTSPYAEDWPDYFTAENGGQAALLYGNNRLAAVTASGTGKTFVMGFAFETINGSQNRSALMERVLNFFWGASTIAHDERPESITVWPPAPNPFNSSTVLRLRLNNSMLSPVEIFDVRGRRVAQLQPPTRAVGYVELIWDGRDVTGRELVSGVYLFRFQTPSKAYSFKVLLLK